MTRHTKITSMRLLLFVSLALSLLLVSVLEVQRQDAGATHDLLTTSTVKQDVEGS